MRTKCKNKNITILIIEIDLQKIFSINEIDLQKTFNIIITRIFNKKLLTNINFEKNLKKFFVNDIKKSFANAFIFVNNNNNFFANVFIIAFNVDFNKNVEIDYNFRN